MTRILVLLILVSCNSSTDYKKAEAVVSDYLQTAFNESLRYEPIKFTTDTVSIYGDAVEATPLRYRVTHEYTLRSKLGEMSFYTDEFIVTADFQLYQRNGSLISDGGYRPSN